MSSKQNKPVAPSCHPLLDHREECVAGERNRRSGEPSGIPSLDQLPRDLLDLRPLGGLGDPSRCTARSPPGLAPSPTAHPGPRLPLTCARHSSNRRRPRAGPRAFILPRRGAANLGGQARSVPLGWAQLRVTSSVRTRHSQTEGASADRLRAQVRKDGGVGSSPFQEVPIGGSPIAGSEAGQVRGQTWLCHSDLLVSQLCTSRP